MTVAQLKAHLDDFGDHLEVVIVTPDGEHWDIEADGLGGTDSDGVPVVTLERGAMRD